MLMPSYKVGIKYRGVKEVQWYDKRAIGKSADSVKKMLMRHFLMDPNAVELHVKKEKSKPFIRTGR